MVYLEEWSIQMICFIVIFQFHTSYILYLYNQNLLKLSFIYFLFYNLPGNWASNIQTKHF